MRTQILQTGMCRNTAVRTFWKLVLRVLVIVTLHLADYFYFGITVYEEIVCYPETAYVQYCRHWGQWL